MKVLSEMYVWTRKSHQISEVVVIRTGGGLHSVRVLLLLINMFISLYNTYIIKFQYVYNCIQQRCVI